MDTFIIINLFGLPIVLSLIIIFFDFLIPIRFNNITGIALVLLGDDNDIDTESGKAWQLGNFDLITLNFELLSVFRKFFLPLQLIYDLRLVECKEFLI